MKLAIIVGHNAKRQGATRKDTGESEFSFNGRIAQIMEGFAPIYGFDARTFYRVDQGYSREIDAVYAEADEWGAQASMELHFNANSNAKANGCEMLTSGSTQSMRLAVCVQDEIVRQFNQRDRGVKTIKANERGGRSLFAGKAPAILTEPFFGSSLSDCAKFSGESAEANLAHSYLQGAARAFDLRKPDPTPTIDTQAPTGGLRALLAGIFKAIFGGKA